MMKRIYRNSIIVLAAVAVIAGCMKFLSVEHPETAPVNSEVEVKFNIQIDIDSGIDYRTTPVIAMLAPASWGIADNAEVTYVTSDADGKTWTMRLAGAGDIEKLSGLDWASGLKSRIGVKGNFEPVEWVAWIADENRDWVGGDSFTGTVTIKFKTGSDNIKCNLAYFIGNTQDAIHNEPEYFMLHEQKGFMTTGGENALVDYTVPKMCKVTPEAYTWEDFVCFHYDATMQVEGVDSPLKGADKIYIQMRALYDGGKETVVELISDKTLMNADARDKWSRWIYPHEFFGIPAGKTIEKISFWMVNEDKSIVVKLPDGNEFSFAENNK